MWASRSRTSAVMNTAFDWPMAQRRATYSSSSCQRSADSVAGCSGVDGYVRQSVQNPPSSSHAGQDSACVDASMAGVAASVVVGCSGVASRATRSTMAAHLKSPRRELPPSAERYSSSTSAMRSRRHPGSWSDPSVGLPHSSQRDWAGCSGVKLVVRAIAAHDFGVGQFGAGMSAAPQSSHLAASVVSVFAVSRQGVLHLSHAKRTCSAVAMNLPSDWQFSPRVYFGSSVRDVTTCRGPLAGAFWQSHAFTYCSSIFPLTLSALPAPGYTRFCILHRKPVKRMHVSSKV